MSYFEIKDMGMMERFDDLIRARAKKGKWGTAEFVQFFGPISTPPPPDDKNTAPREAPPALQQGLQYTVDILFESLPFLGEESREQLKASFIEDYVKADREVVENFKGTKPGFFHTIGKTCKFIWDVSIRKPFHFDWDGRTYGSDKENKFWTFTDRGFAVLGAVTNTVTRLIPNFLQFFPFRLGAIGLDAVSKLFIVEKPTKDAWNFVRWVVGAAFRVALWPLRQVLHRAANVIGYATNLLNSAITLAFDFARVILKNIGCFIDVFAPSFLKLENKPPLLKDVWKEFGKNVVGGVIPILKNTVRLIPEAAMALLYVYVPPAAVVFDKVLAGLHLTPAAAYLSNALGSIGLKVATTPFNIALTSMVFSPLSQITTAVFENWKNFAASDLAKEHHITKNWFEEFCKKHAYEDQSAKDWLDQNKPLNNLIRTRINRRKAEEKARNEVVKSQQPLPKEPSIVDLRIPKIEPPEPREKAPWSREEGFDFYMEYKNTKELCKKIYGGRIEYNTKDILLFNELFGALIFEAQARIQLLKEDQDQQVIKRYENFITDLKTLYQDFYLNFYMETDNTPGASLDAKAENEIWEFKLDEGHTLNFYVEYTNSNELAEKIFDQKKQHDPTVKHDPKLLIELLIEQAEFCVRGLDYGTTRKKVDRLRQFIADLKEISNTRFFDEDYDDIYYDSLGDDCVTVENDDNVGEREENEYCKLVEEGWWGEPVELYPTYEIQKPLPMEELRDLIALDDKADQITDKINIYADLKNVDRNVVWAQLHEVAESDAYRESLEKIRPELFHREQETSELLPKSELRTLVSTKDNSQQIRHKIAEYAILKKVQPYFVLIQLKGLVNHRGYQKKLEEILAVFNEKEERKNGLSSASYSLYKHPIGKGGSFAVPEAEEGKAELGGQPRQSVSTSSSQHTRKPSSGSDTTPTDSTTPSPPSSPSLSGAGYPSDGSNVEDRNSRTRTPDSLESERSWQSSESGAMLHFLNECKNKSALRTKIEEKNPENPREYTESLISFCKDAVQNIKQQMQEKSTTADWTGGKRGLKNLAKFEEKLKQLEALAVEFREKQAAPRDDNEEQEKNSSRFSTSSPWVVSVH